ncbi:hypothetical protein [Rosistilla oblonga]|uniref:hypothetical protein n=1 Tax=Rosistilla oblonga TaxID=2527990 RepID=UPI003A97C8C8
MTKPYQIALTLALGLGATVGLSYWAGSSFDNPVYSTFLLVAGLGITYLAWRVVDE